MTIDNSFFYLLGGVVLISVTAGLIGMFNVLHKKALVGDAIAHAVLPGIILAYLISGLRVSGVLLVGAIVAGFLTATTISLLLKHTKLKQDSVIALVMITFFALGLSLLSYVQLQPLSSQAGLSDFLFGKVAALSERDIYLFSTVCSLLLLAVRIVFKIIFGVVFDNSFMQLRGFYGYYWLLFLNFITIVVVAIGIQAVGVVLMSALLILPVTTAQQLTNKRSKLMRWTVFFSCLAATTGTIMSLNINQLPTGPLISMVLCVCLFVVVMIKWVNSLIKKSWMKFY